MGRRREHLYSEWNLWCSSGERNRNQREYDRSESWNNWYRCCCIKRLHCFLWSWNRSPRLKTWSRQDSDQGHIRKEYGRYEIFAWYFPRQNDATGGKRYWFGRTIGASRGQWPWGWTSFRYTTLWLWTNQYQRSINNDGDRRFGNDIGRQWGDQYWVNNNTCCCNWSEWYRRQGWTTQSVRSESWYPNQKLNIGYQLNITHTDQRSEWQHCSQRNGWKRTRRPEWGQHHRHLNSR